MGHLGFCQLAFPTLPMVIKFLSGSQRRGNVQKILCKKLGALAVSIGKCKYTVLLVFLSQNIPTAAMGHFEFRQLAFPMLSIVIKFLSWSQRRGNVQKI